MAKTLEIAFEPVDNHRLARLCGTLDEHLRQIENAFDITISRRGEQFTLQGKPAQLLRGEQALRHFYGLALNELTFDQLQLGLVEIASRGAESVASPVLLTRRNDLRGRTPRQAEYLRNIQNHDITFGIGPAGTGKTYLAVACAVDAFEREWVERIILTRPAVEAGERLGFLPGDLAQKVDPYLRPLYDALYDLMGYERVSKLFERSLIEIAPLAFMRGRTLNNAFVILDEAQNTTPEQMKMFLTRIGFGAKAVVTGDLTQIDLGRGQRSGLAEARQVLAEVRGIAITEFAKEDVVRHPLVARIVEAYEHQRGVAAEPMPAPGGLLGEAGDELDDESEHEAVFVPPGGMQEDVAPRAGLTLTVQKALDGEHKPLAPKKRHIRNWAAAALQEPAAEVTVRLVGEEEGRILNRDFRSRDYATNVLTFSYGEVEPDCVHGDLVLCVPVVVREAAEQGKALDAHFAHLIIHGMLHLQGWDHEEEQEAEEMEALEREILAGLGYDDPYAAERVAEGADHDAADHGDVFPAAS
jgi:phosphate starvation-inducible PhoH-like protein